MVHIPAWVWERDQRRLPGGGDASAEFWLSWKVKKDVPGSKGTGVSRAGACAGKSQMVQCSDGAYCMRQGLGRHETRFSSLGS